MWASLLSLMECRCILLIAPVLVGDGVGFRQCRGSVVVGKLLSVSVSPLSLVGDGGVGFRQCRGWRVPVLGVAKMVPVRKNSFEFLLS